MLKKYQNRRLFDPKRKGDKTKSSGHYVTVPEVRDRLVAGETVELHPSGDDVTAEVLISVIAEDLRKGFGPTPIQLRRFIQSYYPE